MEKIIAGVLEVATDADVRIMEAHLTGMGKCMLYLNTPHDDGIYMTEEEKRQHTIEDFMNEVLDVQEFKGECAGDYKTIEEYIYNDGDFGKDYFDSWMYGCSDHPDLEEIKFFCECLQEKIRAWEWAVEAGWIDPKDHWDE